MQELAKTLNLFLLGTLGDLFVIFFYLGQEQLEKAREIIKRLKDDKEKLSEEMSTKIKSSEQSLEEERENLMLELKRGKSAALGLMQVAHFFLNLM